MKYTHTPLACLFAVFTAQSFAAHAAGWTAFHACCCLMNILAAFSYLQ